MVLDLTLRWGGGSSMGRVAAHLLGVTGGARHPGS